MLALDTNVLLRYLLNDDAEQAKRAVKLLSSKNEFWISQGVWLELVWVLNRAKGYAHADVIDAIRHLLALPGMEISQTDEIMQSLAWYASGMDFGDALHLANASEAQALHSFDRDFQRKAQQLTTVPPVLAA